MGLALKRRQLGNLISNPGFETGDTDNDGDPDGWKRDTDMSLTQSTQQVRSGRYSGFLEATASANRWMGVYQNFPQGDIIGGNKYRVTAYVWSPSSSASAPRLIVHENNNGTIATTDGTLGAEKWEKIEVEFTASEENFKHVVELRWVNHPSSGDSYYIDDVTLEDITERTGPGGAARLDDDTDIKVLSDPSHQSNSFSIFMELKKTGDGGGIIRKSISGAWAGRLFFTGTNKAEFDSRDPDTGTEVVNIQSTAFEKGVWSTLAATYSYTDQVARIFKNGTKDNEATGIADMFWDLSGDIRVGKVTTSPSKTDVARVLIYDRALSPAEVQRLHEGGLVREGLVVHYDFSDPLWHRDSVTDKSGRHNHGIVEVSQLHRAPGPHGKPTPDRLGLDLTFEDWPHGRNLSDEWVGNIYVGTPDSGASIQVVDGKLVFDSGTDGTKRTALIGAGQAGEAVAALVWGSDTFKTEARASTDGIVQGTNGWHKAYIFGRSAGFPHYENGVDTDTHDNNDIPTGTNPMATYPGNSHSFGKTVGFWNGKFGHDSCEGKSTWEYVKVKPTLKSPVSGRKTLKR